MNYTCVEITTLWENNVSKHSILRFEYEKSFIILICTVIQMKFKMALIKYWYFCECNINILTFHFCFYSFSVILINSNLSATLQIHTRLRNEEESVIMNLFPRRSSSAFIFCFVLAAHEIDYKSISHFENNVYNEVT